MNYPSTAYVSSLVLHLMRSLHKVDLNDDNPFGVSVDSTGGILVFKTLSYATFTVNTVPPW